MMQAMPVASCIPEKYVCLFDFSHFNAMQSILLEKVLRYDNNLVIGAPTGSGKTAVHELAIVRCLMTMATPGDIKCIYIAPNKALCQQHYSEWAPKFGKLGLLVLEVTGDIDTRHCLGIISNANIPEKWDSITRSWRQHIALLGLVNLLLIDEIHHVGESRGPTLETVIVRMQILKEEYTRHTAGSSKECSPRLRMIALSATFPNLIDVGVWLRCSEQDIFYFDDGFRPVPLTIHTIAYPNMGNIFLFEKSLDEKVPDIIRRYSDHKQSIVFCASKKTTEQLAAYLSSRMGIYGHAASVGEAASISDSTLKNLVIKGFAYHHAGLPPSDRGKVEELFLVGKIAVLCATTTLAHGVNLPAHLVVIKGTNSWRGSGIGYEKMTRSDIIQMTGRAGRPGFDSEGVAVIMTSHDDRHLYESISLSAETVESQLLGRLVEAICTEITQKVIKNIIGATEWIKRTYFYIRISRNPTHYGLRSNNISQRDIDEFVEGICLSCLTSMEEANIISLQDDAVSPLAEAGIMTKHSILFETMRIFATCPRKTSINQLIDLLSESTEIQKPLRRFDKKVLNEANSKIRFPTTGRVLSSSQKTAVLLQAAIAKIIPSDFFLKVEQSDIVEGCIRILGALVDYSIEKLHGKLLESTLLLRRALVVRMWEGEHQFLAQCPGIPDILRKRLEEISFQSINDFKTYTIATLQTMVTCSQLEATRLIKFMNFCLKSAAKITTTFESGSKSITYELIPLTESKPNEFASNSEPSTSNAIILSYESQTGELVCYRQLITPRQIKFAVPLPPQFSYDLICTRLIADWVGLDSCVGFRMQPDNNPTNSAGKRKAKAVQSEGIAVSEGGTKKLKKSLKDKENVAISPNTDIGEAKQSVISFEKYEYQPTPAHKASSPVVSSTLRAAASAGAKVPKQTTLSILQSKAKEVQINWPPSKPTVCVPVAAAAAVPPKDIFFDETIGQLTFFDIDKVPLIVSPSTDMMHIGTSYEKNYQTNVNLNKIIAADVIASSSNEISCKTIPAARVCDRPLLLSQVLDQFDSSGFF